MMPEAHTIYVVEDDGDLRDSLVALFEDTGHRVYAFASAEELLACKALPDSACVVTDVRLPGMDGLSLLRRLREEGAVLPVLLITGHGDIPLAVAAMKAGATEFLEKPFSPDALLNAVRTAMDPQRGGGFETDSCEGARLRLQELTPREMEVLEHIVEGLSSKMAARKVGVSPRTIEFHRAHIMQKTGATSLAHLVRLWLAAQPRNGGKRAAGAV